MNAPAFASVTVPALEPGTASDDGLYYRSPHGEYYIKCSVTGNVGRWRQVKAYADGVLYVPAFDAG